MKKAFSFLHNERKQVHYFKWDFPILPLKLTKTDARTILENKHKIDKNIISIIVKNRKFKGFYNKEKNVIKKYFKNEIVKIVNYLFSCIFLIICKFIFYLKYKNYNKFSTQVKLDIKLVYKSATILNPYKPLNFP